MISNNGLLSGKGNVMGKMVATSWKGLQVFRQIASNPHNYKTANQQAIRIKETELANRWSAVLTADQKALWDAYAGMTSSLTAKESSEGTSGAIIPSRGKLFSGFNAYIGTNIDGYASGIAIMDIPPINRTLPPAPSAIVASYGASNITVTWIDPIMPETPDAQFIRIWAKTFDKSKIHAQLIASVAIGEETFSFNKMRGGGSIKPANIIFSATALMLVGVQLDTIAAYTGSEAPILSAGSEVVTVKAGIS